MAKEKDMFQTMIPTKIPFGCINIMNVKAIDRRKDDKFYLIDDVNNWWRIEETVYLELEKRGIKFYERY